MHNIEPFYNWRHLYKAEEDSNSPFFGRTYSQFEYTNTIYNFYIHPQWDYIGSETLYIKILFSDYSKNFAIIELLGEWNDTLHNDIMFLKREVIDELIFHGIKYFILIGENVFNFHSSDDSYYQEWKEDIEDGWIVLVNFRQHVLDEMKNERLFYYLFWSEILNNVQWRKTSPHILFKLINEYISKSNLLKE
ncbi:MAG TPA: hypothetical protein PK995_02315 [Bacteroidia bacterium]|nr:hypothetical protein [Bacteroidia bacterium]